MYIIIHICNIMQHTYNTFEWHTIYGIQDPIYESVIDRISYFDTYGPLLETFDGLDVDSFIEEFFRRSPVNETVLIFVDEDSRLDFQYMAIDMELVPPIVEICEGESKKDKIKRKDKTKQQRKPKTVVSNEGKKKARVKQMEKTITSLQCRIEQETNANKLEKLDIKLRKTKEALVRLQME